MGTSMQANSVSTTFAVRSVSHGDTLLPGFLKSQKIRRASCQQRRPMRLPSIPCLLPLLAMLSLGACGTTGTPVEPASAPGAGTGPETIQPQPEPEPEPPPPCIPTHAGSCASAEDFRTETESLAAEYREHVNFKNQWGLSHVKADYAYGHVSQIKGEDVAPGAGVTIGFIDSGIDQGHRDFAGKTITEHFLLGAPDETGHRFSHGTAVASVAAAIRSQHHFSAHGVAWGADIAMFAIPTGSAGDRPYRPISLQGLAGEDPVWEGLFNYVLVPRPGVPEVDILNLSIGYPGIIDSYSEQDLRAYFGRAIATMAQADAEEKIILVWAAGNAHGRRCVPTTEHCENDGEEDAINALSVEVLPGLVARIEELQGHSIAVVALRSDGEIADFSNRCGIAADFCIAAPGAGIRVAYLGPDPDTGVPVRGWNTGGGTSYAAPFVAGGLAVMKQLFRDQLSNTELVTRLFETADDEGVYADSTVYGHGAMDLRAATWPVGVLDVPVESDRADGAGAALLGTRLQAGAAFGDGLERSLAGTEIAAFDDLGAPFWFDLGDFTAGAAARSMAADVHQSPAPAWSRTEEAVHWRIGYREPPGDGGDGHLALADRAVTLTLADRYALRGTVFTTEGAAEQPPASGASVTWRPAGSPLGLHAGWVHERETLLGSSADGAFGALSADAAFVGVEAEAELGGWRIGADAEVGTVASAARGGIVTGVSPLTTTAFTLHASTAFAGDGSLRLSVSQPLRVERGSAALSVPTGRTKDGAVVRSPAAADLGPSGRQIDVSAQWQQPLSVGEVSVGAVVTHQPGHRAAADPELMFLSGWRWAY